MKVLNLYCGIGGNRAKWENVDVVSVDNHQGVLEQYQKNFPKDKVILGDAHEYLLNHYKDFDFIWSSPPCQSHSRMVKFTRHNVTRYPDMSLYQEIIFLKNFYKGDWVVENVKPYYEPLIKPTAIIERHYFWSNYTIGMNFKIPNLENITKMAYLKNRKQFEEFIGVRCDNTIYFQGSHDPMKVLRNCVQSDLGLYVFNQRIERSLFS